MRPPDRIRLRLLGGFEVTRDDGLPIRLSTKKVCALVAFLAMSRKHAATREELATLLWGSCSEQQARQSLRQALVLLRKDLRSSNILSTNADVVQLLPGFWSVDALEFEKLTDSSKLEDLERATELLGGEFLAGLAIEEEGYDDWLRAQRSQFQMAAGRVLATFAERTEAAGNGQQAIAAVKRLLALDPLREDWQRLALRLYARHRGQHEALAQAKAFEELLRRELDVHPEAETRALVEEIRSGDIARAAAPAGGALSGPRDVADGASTPATLVDEETRQADIAQRQAPRHRWVALRKWPARRVAALSTIAALMLVAGVFELTRSGSVPVGNGVLDKRSTERPAPIQDPWQSPRPPSQSAADPPAGNRRALTPIIVLPFTTYGDAAGSIQLMADMMTDDLTNMLSRVSGLRVISRQTARRYQGAPIDVAAIGADLGIRYVLEGSMRMRDDKLRVSVELVDPKTRLTAWSGRIERDGADRQAVQDEIVGRLARELQFEVFQAEGQHGSKEPGVDELIFRGWAAQQAGGRAGVRALKEAEGYFLQALERDPRNIRALVGLAAYHVSVQFDAVDPTPHLAKAEELLRDAIHRFPNDAGAFYFMGVIDRARGNSEVAVEWFERAVAVNPSHAPSYSLMGASLTRIGRASDGLEYIKYAMRLSPRDPALPIWLRNAGETELELGHHDQAIEYFRRSLALHPRHAYPLAGIAAAHALAGRMPEAHEYAAELKSAAPHQSRERLLQRFAGDKGRPEGRLVEGLRLALDGD